MMSERCCQLILGLTQEGKNHQLLRQANPIEEGAISNWQIRLSGFLGGTEIDHPQPLTVMIATGQTFKAEDVSEEAFADGNPPGNIGQYDFEIIISDLPKEFEIVFSIPTKNDKDVKLAVSPLSIQEWKQVAAKAEL